MNSRAGDNLATPGVNRNPRVARERLSAEQKCSRYQASLLEGVRRGYDSICKIFLVEGIMPDFSLHCRQSNCSYLTRAVKEWTTVITVGRRKGRMERAGFRSSVALLKKVFPEPCACMRTDLKSAFAARVVEKPTGELDPEFLQFIDLEVKKMFPVGWDAKYEGYALRENVSYSACVEATKNEGGAQSCFKDYDSYTAVHEGKASPGELPAFKYAEVPTSGKLRPLTITPAVMSHLRPLHKMIYDRLSRQRWLLRGNPSVKKFESAGFTYRSPLLSGDYAGATDNLDLRVTKAILASISSRCRHIPEPILYFASLSLNPDIRIGESVHRVEKGQMMGSLLSFPLLCLYNRLVSLYALGPVPMLINGDDLVAETSEPEKWFRMLPPLGLHPEESKTGYSHRSFDINSQRFLVRKSGIVEVPTVRARVLEPRPELPTIGGQLDGFVRNLYSGIRNRAENVFLSRKGAVMLKALKAGIQLSDLGFSQRNVPLLRRRGWFNLASKYAKLCGRMQTPPKLQPPIGETINVYGKMDAVETLFAKMVENSERFGAVRLSVDSRKYIDSWWKQVNGNVVNTSVVNPRFRHWSIFGKLAGCSNNRLYFGDLMTRSVFLARLRSSFDPKISPASVPKSMKPFLSLETRLNPSGMLWKRQVD